MEFIANTTSCTGCSIETEKNYLLMARLTWPYVGYIIEFYATKIGSRDSRDTKVEPIGSRTRLGPSMDPALALQYTQHGPLYIDYIFAFYATIEGPRRVLDPMRDN